MAGIYTRDQFAQQLANAIENAQARRQAHVDREAARTTSNMQAIGNFAKALGRTWETWDGKSDEEKLAALQKEREEAVAQQEYEQAVKEKYNEQVAQRNAVNDYLFQRGLRAGANPYLREMNSTNDMQGYTPESSYAAPNYSEILKKRGLY